MRSWGDWFIFTSNVMGAACQMVGDTQHTINHTLFRHTCECGMLRFFLRCFVCLGRKKNWSCDGSVWHDYRHDSTTSHMKLTSREGLWDECPLAGGDASEQTLVRVCVFDRERAFERPVWLTLVIKVAYMVISPVSPSYALLTYLKLLPKVPSINGHTVNRSPQSTCTFPHYDLCHNMWQFPPLILFQSSSF